MKLEISSHVSAVVGSSIAMDPSESLERHEPASTTMKMLLQLS